MSEVKRYRHFPAQYARMFIDTLPSGEYVTGADYDALSADNKRLREALVAASKAHSKAEVGLIVDAALAGSKEGDV